MRENGVDGQSCMRQSQEWVCIRIYQLGVVYGIGTDSVRSLFSARLIRIYVIAAYCGICVLLALLSLLAGDY